MTPYKGWKMVPVEFESAQSYPAGAHPPLCPIIDRLVAVRLSIGDYYTRWYGVKRAEIGPDLRMHVTGFNDNFEEMMSWEDSPKDIARLFNKKVAKPTSGRKSGGKR